MFLGVDLDFVNGSLETLSSFVSWCCSCFLESFVIIFSEYWLVKLKFPPKVLVAK